ncbi:uncharacterized protein LOC113292800 isoform X1 [Papaver somniferum]|uniref:uncharacterized protein LOC113292800 isoform X1 n=1 Tax=Papaver somniferum TaxID=3469 RepID=UPI000E6F7B02|nr:uncharacterized protein LOC113292800 isoform X1 [Papaver somniferum]
MKGDCNTQTMMLIDFSNSFNLVDRYTLIREVRTHFPSIAKWVEFCYSSPSRLYYNDVVLSSAKGVQQGDPLVPLLFVLALHPLISQIASQCTLEFNSWYLDDGTLADDTLEVEKALKIIQNKGPKRGLYLNLSKTELFWPSPDPRCSEDGLFPANIGKASTGVKLLGGPVSLDAQFCSNMVLNRVDKTIQMMQKIKKLQDPQCELLLMRNCTGVSRLYFTLRTTSPLEIHAVTSRFDEHLFQYLRHIIVGDGAGLGLVQQRLVTLPIKDGGLGVYTMVDIGTYCNLASTAQTQQLQHTILKISPSAELSRSFEHALQVSRLSRVLELTFLLLGKLLHLLSRARTTNIWTHAQLMDMGLVSWHSLH